MSNILRKMSAEEFVRRLVATSSETDRRYGFFVGAGCSVTSGIPACSRLVKERWLPRLRDVRDPNRRDLDAWAQEQFHEYDPEQPGSLYGRILEELFLQPEERQREIEALCEGAYPGFGYATLASLVAMSDGRFNVVLTTNFDDLASDALYIYTSARPLVISHESLANFIRPTRTRPLVVKLHGDHRLAPKNTNAETCILKEEVEQRVRALLHDRGLIFLGYGGHDQSVISMVSKLSEHALPLGVFWVSDEEPTSPIRPWLESRDAVWVQKGDFDELMLLMRVGFKLAHPDPKRFQSVFDRYTEKYNELYQRISDMPADSRDALALREAARVTDLAFSDWHAVLISARRIQKEDPGKAVELYEEGLRRFPDQPRLHCEYADFLSDILGLADEADVHFQRALELSPDDPMILSSLADYLISHRHDPSRAYEYRERALKLAPDNKYLLVSLAEHMRSHKQDLEAAVDLYERALAIDPTYDWGLAQYAQFCYRVRSDLDKAESLYQRLVETNPRYKWGLLEYAQFMCVARGNLDAADELFKRALEVDPNYRPTLRAYASFLRDKRGDHATAQQLFERAESAESQESRTAFRYAQYLHRVQGNNEKADLFYARAIREAPKKMEFLSEYADFLQNVMHDQVRAEELIKGAGERTDRP